MRKPTHLSGSGACVRRMRRCSSNSSQQSAAGSQEQQLETTPHATGCPFYPATLMRIPEFLIIALVAPKNIKKSRKKTTPSEQWEPAVVQEESPVPVPIQVQVQQGDDEDDNDNDNVDAAKMTRQGCRCNERMKQLQRAANNQQRQRQLRWAAVASAWSCH